MTKYTAEWCAANPEEAAMVINNLQEKPSSACDVDACNAAVAEALSLDAMADEEIPVAPAARSYYSHYWEY